MCYIGIFRLATLHIFAFEITEMPLWHLSALSVSKNNYRLMSTRDVFLLNFLQRGLVRFYCETMLGVIILILLTSFHNCSTL